MKVFSFAILAAVAASASASAPASLLLRGSDKKRDLKVNDIRLLKPDPDKLPDQAKDKLPEQAKVGPELPEKALANANANADKGPFGGRGEPPSTCAGSGDSCDGINCCEGLSCQVSLDPNTPSTCGGGGGCTPAGGDCSGFSDPCCEGLGCLLNLSTGEETCLS